MNYNLTLLRDISKGNNEFVIDMIRTFIDVAPPAIERIAEFAADGKFEAVYLEAHPIATNAKYLGAEELESELRRIEINAKEGIDLESMPGQIERVKVLVEELIASFRADFNLETS